MEPIQPADLMDIAQYEKARPQFRQRALAAKEARRLLLGPNMAFLFENRTTVLYQIQEMIRVERMVDGAAMLHEMATYNELIPPEGGLSASLLIGYDTPEERDAALRALLGLERHLLIQGRGHPTAPALFDPRQIATDRLSSVQYLRFQLSPALREDWLKLGGQGGLSLVCTHPGYPHTAVLEPRLVEALWEDLSGQPA